MQVHISQQNAHTRKQIHTYIQTEQKWDAHISQLSAHIHIVIHTYGHTQNGSAHVTTKRTNAYTSTYIQHTKHGSAHFTTECTHTYINTYIQRHKEWKRTFHN